MGLEYCDALMVFDSIAEFAFKATRLELPDIQSVLVSIDLPCPFCCAIMPLGADSYCSSWMVIILRLRRAVAPICRLAQVYSRVYRLLPVSLAASATARSFSKKYSYGCTAASSSRLSNAEIEQVIPRIFAKTRRHRIQAKKPFSEVSNLATAHRRMDDPPSSGARHSATTTGRALVTSVIPTGPVT